MRRACHVWHMRRAGGGAGGVRPRVVREPGSKVSRATRGGLSHAWHMNLRFDATCGSEILPRATRGMVWYPSLHAWHMN